MLIKNFFGHLKTVNKHRFIVCRLCFKMGLYWQGLTHDLSKYSPVEFFPSVRFFQGNRSPIDKEREVYGYSLCWLHHKGHNKHHWQYWVDFRRGETIFYDAPIKYLREMVADRIAACMVYQKDKYQPNSALLFLQNSRERKFIPAKTYEVLEYYLTIVANNDLDVALKMIKNDKRYQ